MLHPCKSVAHRNRWPRDLAGRNFPLLADHFGRFIVIVKSRLSISSISTWVVALVLAGWLLAGSGILPFGSPAEADAWHTQPEREPGAKRGLQIDLRIFSLRFHVHLAGLDPATV